MHPENPQRFLSLLVGLSSLAVAMTGAVCLVVDPYGLYRPFPVREGFNAQKPKQKGHERMVRAADLARLRPDGLVLGTSRAQVGLDPLAAAWKHVGVVRAANAALSDGSTYEALRYLQHAHALSPVKLVVFGADYLSFVGAGRFTSDFTETRLSVRANFESQPTFAFDDVPAALLSFDTLRISRQTWREQHSPSYFFDTGRRRPDTMAGRLEEQGGVRATFRWSERDYADSYTCAQPARLDAHLADFDSLVAFCKAHDIRLVVFFSPSHARSQVLLQEAGLWAEVRRFKRELGRRAADFELWEFGGADPRTTAEEVPSAGDRTTPMRWYWESSHYKSALGDLVLARVLVGGAQSELADWGERLDLSRVVTSMARVDEELESWRAAHPADLAELRVELAHARAAATCEEQP